MEKDVISEADDTIVIDVPEQKEYVISIANNSYKIKPIFSIYVYEQLIEDINEENWKNKIAKILQLEINKTGEGSPSINDILNDPTEPCKKYIKVLLEQNRKLKEFYDENHDENDEYKKFENAVKQYNKYTFENMKSGMLEIQKKIATMRNNLFAQIPKYDFSSAFSDFNDIARGIQNQIRDSLEKFKSSLPEFNWDDWNEGIKYWGENGWTIIPHAPAGLFKTKIADKSERDKIALRYLRKNDMEDLFADLQEMRLNHKDLNEAIYCYDNKCYKACAMILCSMIDGMIYKRQPVKKDSRRKGDSKFFKKIKESGLKEDLLQQSFFLLQMNNLIAYLTKLFENGNDFQLDTKVLNRNFLLHGMSKKSVSQKECKQLFLAVYNTKLIIEGVNGRLKKKNVNITQMLSN